MTMVQEWLFAKDKPKRVMNTFGPCTPGFKEKMGLDLYKELSRDKSTCEYLLSLSSCPDETNRDRTSLMLL